MGVPVLQKTWQMAVNQTVPAQGSGNATDGLLLLTIKNALKGFANNPWTVVGSSNAGGTTGSPTGSGALDGVDRWSTQSDINTGGSNGRHAWIVLQQTGISAHFQILISITAPASMTMKMTVSPSAGFTGGSATVDPTATDGIVMNANGSWVNGSNVQFQANIWQSTDGQCTRVVVWCTTTMLTMFWLFDKPQNPIPNWTHPLVASFFWTNSGLAITYNLLTAGGSDSNQTIIQGPAGTGLVANFSGEGNAAGTLLANLLNVGSVANDLDASVPLFPVGVWCSVPSGGRGRNGYLADLWWTPSAMANGDTLPNNAATRQFIAFGPLVFPWTGDATTALLA